MERGKHINHGNQEDRSKGERERMGNEEWKVMERIGGKKKHQTSRKMWNFFLRKRKKTVISICTNEKCEKTKGFLWMECTVSASVRRRLCTIKARLWFHTLKPEKSYARGESFSKLRSERGGIRGRENEVSPQKSHQKCQLISQSLQKR